MAEKKDQDKIELNVEFAEFRLIYSLDLREENRDRDLTKL